MEDVSDSALEKLRGLESSEPESSESLLPGDIALLSERSTPIPADLPKWYHRSRPRFWGFDSKKDDFEIRPPARSSLAKKRRRRRRLRICLIIAVVLLFLGSAAGVTYVSLVGALIRRLSPARPHNGLQHVLENWKEPTAAGPYRFDWRDDFSRDVVPKNCHSHNDYWRDVPLYQALAAGCVGVEADIWLMQDGELRVSHTWRSIRTERTLRNLYLDPLANILTNRNVSVASTEAKEVGVFEVDPNISVILLIDFKDNGEAIWPVLMEQLQPLHEKGWLTYYNGQEVVKGPLTIVGTGETPFERIQQNNTDRIIFYDAPLDDISNPIYTSANSYYASVKMRKAISTLWLNRISRAQQETLQRQINAAAAKGLVSRYWGTPSWPISLRTKIWFTLSEMGVGILNVDELDGATRWDWNWCVVAGLSLCGNR
ncbi:uncharacterized protein EI97DRAFT_455126 [Westerdykella ornata]|uniref:Altered inheritance of mitochondria protein 6 n=1 Tax=Westerdykella ornata TaxID=318751 RepID=A0A6A6JVS6_WESOR|nr:uncharacterized protein EI97DRAFT_455126 [Westerdykella ornata]KAF2280213.1 hypothetical protein EI97DRAFT_455126 [Westerdykella ornata]